MRIGTFGKTSKIILPAFPEGGWARAFPVLATLTALASCGSDSTGPTYTRVFIDQVTLVAMPFVDQSGIAWDFLSGPDPFFNLVASPATVVLSSRTEAYSDISPSSLPLSWNLSPVQEITDFQQSYLIQLYDLDPLDPDDLIGATSSFRAQDLLASHPPSYQVSSVSGTIVFRLTLRWQ